MLSEIKTKNKKGVSEMVGYVLLITLAVVMGVIAYNWMKTYIPREAGSCPDGVSIFIKEAGLNESNSQLSLTLKNNGKFNINGYFIYARNSSNQEIATIDLSQYLNKSFGGIIVGNYIKFFSLQEDILIPGSEVTHIFNIPPTLNLYSLSIIPTRFQEENNKERFVSCGNALTNQIVGEPEEPCIAEEVSVTCDTRVCGSQTNNCGHTISCGTCILPEVCNAAGACTTQCTDTCATYGYNCGTQTVCGNSINCGSCQSGFGCNATGKCVALCGNGIINTTVGETCDNGINNGVICTPPAGGSCNYCSLTCQIVTTTIGNGACDTGETCAQEPTACQGKQAACSSGNICISGSCQPISGGVGCTNYCISLTTPYTTSTCVGPSGQCHAQYGGTLESGGNIYCPSGTINCCCIP